MNLKEIKKDIQSGRCAQTISLCEEMPVKNPNIRGGAGYNAPSGASSSSSLRVQNTSKGFKQT